MDNYWDNYIQTNICQPIEMALQGRDPGVPELNGRLDLYRKIWYIKTKNEKGDLLNQYLRPYMEEFLFHPQDRMYDGYDIRGNESLFWRHAATLTISDYLEYNAYVKNIFEDLNLCDVLEIWLNQCEGDYIHRDLHREILVFVVVNGYQTDWEDLHQRVKPELTHCPSDYDKKRLEYFCFLDGIIKIANNQEMDIEQKQELWTQLEQKWSILSTIYSVMTGKIIFSGHKHFAALIGQFRSSEREYALLMVAALRHHPQVLQGGKAKQIMMDLERAAKEIKQKQDLNKLCSCLFPSEQWRDYDLNAPKMTAAEMAAKINFLEKELANSNTRKEDQDKLEAYAEYLKQQLGQSISMEELTKAILNCPAQIANLIFTQLDLRLEDVNPVWTAHRKELKCKVLAKEMEEKNLLTDTCNKVTAIEQVPRSVHIAHNTAPIHIENQNNYEGIHPQEVKQQLNTIESCHLLESTTERSISTSR